MDHFHDFFLPALRARGYDGAFQRRPGPAKRDGCATFWRRKRLRLAASQEVQLDRAPRAAPPGARAAHPPRERTHNVALLCHLVPVGRDGDGSEGGPDAAAGSANQAGAGNGAGGLAGRGICVANAHLFWDPEYEALKLAQA